MSLHNHSIKFFLKKEAKAKVQGLPVYARITYDRKKAELFIGEYCLPAQWNEEKGLPTKQPRLKELLTHIENRINEIKRELHLDKKEVSAAILKELYLCKGEKFEMTLLNYIDAHIEKISKLVLDYQPSTIKHYKTTRKHLFNYLTHLKRKDIQLSLLNQKFVEDWDYFMLTNPTEQYNIPIERNTANKYHSKLRTMLTVAQKDELIDLNPYLNYKVKDKEVKIEYLTNDELSKIESATFMNGIEKAKDFFLFTCYTALRFGDAASLTNDEVTKDSSGQYWINKKQQKTNNMVRIPMIKRAVAIYEKYALTREITGKVLPSITNQKVNAYLKNIADIVGINKKLTHHIARHTCATVILLENGIPLEVAAEFLGHSDLSSTRIYAKITDKVKIDALNRIDKI
jgi:integrase/recombinase XerD